MKQRTRLAMSLGTIAYAFISAVMTAFLIGGAVGLGKASDPDYMKTACIAGVLWPVALIHTAIHYDDMAATAKGAKQ